MVSPNLMDESSWKRGMEYDAPGRSGPPSSAFDGDLGFPERTGYSGICRTDDHHAAVMAPYGFRAASAVDSEAPEGQRTAGHRSVVVCDEEEREEF